MAPAQAASRERTAWPKGALRISVPAGAAAGLGTGAAIAASSFPGQPAAATVSVSPAAVSGASYSWYRSMMSGTDPGKVMGSLFAAAPGPRVSTVGAAELGGQPAGGPVAMYVGGGYVIDAPRTGLTVQKIQMDTDRYAPTYGGAVRREPPGGLEGSRTTPHSRSQGNPTLKYLR